MKSESELIRAAVNRLVIAVWAAVVALLINAVVSIIPWMLAPPYISQFNESWSAQSDGFQEDFPMSVSAQHSEPGRPFYELPLEEQIEQASVIAVAEYKEGSDGRMRAIITDILKKEPGTVSYYDVGDEHPGSSYYPMEGRSHGDGVILFFTGSPARMSVSMTYRGERISSLGDMPLSLFREKCGE
ncbi:hypothetical protein K8B33_14665 [Alcanivorax sp. JB21]|uniref:hypothetical protein n=1 Tax=Alcanivorax limicola TaxID=2874102 RepID=UPI001CBFEE14|nr:hypothetical protein [Alcanivorax limicola]MBZ2190350.1 hypothetical protein [Alcanivorax limicola]